MLDQLKRYAVLVVIMLLMVVTMLGYLRNRAYQGQLASLRNQLASSDRTVEELKGTYAKLAREDEGLKSSNKELQKLLSKTNQDLIAEQQLSVYWKGKYEFVLSHQPADPGAKPPFDPPAHQEACTASPKLYTASQDIGFIKLTVDTFTVDPSYQQRLTLSPGSKPLTLTLDLTRDREMKWRTHVTSSDDRVGVEIGVNSVNLEPLQPRWYERIRLHFDIGAGLDGPGALIGGGAAVQFGKFELGPSVWATTGGGQFGGLNFSWSPFQRGN